MEQQEGRGITAHLMTTIGIVVMIGMRAHADTTVCAYQYNTYQDGGGYAACIGPVQVTTPSDLAAAMAATKAFQTQLDARLAQQKADYDTLIAKLDALEKELARLKSGAQSQKDAKEK